MDPKNNGDYRLEDKVSQERYGCIGRSRPRSMGGFDDKPGVKYQPEKRQCIRPHQVTIDGEADSVNDDDRPGIKPYQSEKGIKKEDKKDPETTKIKDNKENYKL